MQGIAQGCAQANLSNTEIEEFIAYFPFNEHGLDVEKINKLANLLSVAHEELETQKALLKNMMLQRKTLQQYLLNGIVRV